MFTTKLQANKPEDIIIAAHMLQTGELVAIPTETVYGLAANALDFAAVAKIFAAKSRPQDNPLIVHISTIEQAWVLTSNFCAQAQALAEHFWPGPLTIILPKSDCVPQEVTAGLDTVALRMPAHPAALALLNACGLPLAAPSANLSGSPSPTIAQHVWDDMQGRIGAILDGGSCEVGVESTVVSLAGERPVLLRPGGITTQQIEQILGCEIAVSPGVEAVLAKSEVPQSPGQKYRHYAPKARLTLVRGSLPAFLRFAQKEKPDGLLVFDGDETPEEWVALRYGAQNNPQQQAQQLFAKLREIDALGLRTVLVRSPEKEGLGFAVYNRLFRAAEFREVVPNFIIGVAGPTGAGKSTAAKLLAELGCVTIDGDALAREVVQPGSPILAQLAARFGADILQQDSTLTLDRQLLAKRAFASDEARRDLNAITHPAITQLALEQAEKAGERPVVIDAAALLESELAEYCDHIVIVTAPEDVRLVRIMQRGNVTQEAAKQRMTAQANMDFTGHTIIENTQGEAQLAHALKALLAKMLPLGGCSGIGAADDAGVSAQA